MTTLKIFSRNSRPYHGFFIDQTSFSRGRYTVVGRLSLQTISCIETVGRAPPKKHRRGRIRTRAPAAPLSRKPLGEEPKGDRFLRPQAVASRPPAPQVSSGGVWGFSPGSLRSLGDASPRITFSLEKTVFSIKLGVF